MSSSRLTSIPCGSLIICASLLLAFCQSSLSQNPSQSKPETTTASSKTTAASSKTTAASSKTTAASSKTTAASSKTTAASSKTKTESKTTSKTPVQAATKDPSLIHSILLPHVDAEFPPGEGREVFVSNCTVCHSLRYISMQPDFPEKTWEKEVDKMRKTWTAHISDSDAKKIVAYLTAVKGKKK